MKKSTGAWVKLERGDDWGREYFSLPGKSKSEYGTCNANLGLTFQDNSPLKVKWPDGSITEEAISFKPFSRQVSDHGKTYNVECSLAGFNYPLRGIAQWFPLDAVEIWIES